MHIKQTIFVQKKEHKNHKFGFSWQIQRTVHCHEHTLVHSQNNRNSKKKKKKICVVDNIHDKILHFIKNKFQIKCFTCE